MGVVRCKQCGGMGARRIEINVRHRDVARVWHVRVCRDCWRAWEALLDSGAEGIQDMLAYNRDSQAPPPLFLW